MRGREKKKIVFFFSFIGEKKNFIDFFLVDVTIDSIMMMNEKKI